MFLFHQWEFDPITIFSYNSNISSLIQNSDFFRWKIHHSFCVPRHLSQDLPLESWESSFPVNFEKQTARVSGNASEDYLHFNKFEMLPVYGQYAQSREYPQWICVYLPVG